MQNHRLPPPHPSLPAVPPASVSQYQPFYSSHYAQAYSQSYAQAYAAHNPVANNPVANNPLIGFSGLRSSNPSPAWYQPGSSRCTYQGCSFIGSFKALETHMMDRHLIYPPGWEKRPRKQDWDADPSLKGKPISIQGTNQNLDKPEDLEAWLAERKRRWPTAPRVEEKKQKMTEALARGQLPDHLGFKGNKRQRTDEGGDARYGDRGRGRGRGRGNLSQGRARTTDAGWQGRSGRTTAAAEASQAATPLPVAQIPAVTSAAETDDDNDDSPEVISSRAPIDHIPPDTDSTPISRTPNIKEQVHASKSNRQSKRPLPQPRKAPHNPFASRPTLLRNLLLPEIRMTTSNLSQAIRFLVDNDFLQDVEETPGAIDSKMIQVIPGDSSPVARDAVSSIQ